MYTKHGLKRERRKKDINIESKADKDRQRYKDICSRNCQKLDWYIRTSTCHYEMNQAHKLLWSHMPA